MQNSSAFAKVCSLPQFPLCLKAPNTCRAERPGSIRMLAPKALRFLHLTELFAHESIAKCPLRIEAKS